MANPTDVTWEFTEKEAELLFTSTLDLSKKSETIYKRMEQDWVSFFQHLFFWDIKDIWYEDDLFKVNIILGENKTYELAFSMISELNESQEGNVYFILEIPFGRLKALISQWEIAVHVTKDSKHPKASVLEAESRILLMGEWVKSIIKWNKVKEKLEEKMPSHLEALKNYLLNP